MEKIIIIHLLGSGVNNDFTRLNLLQNVYPSRNYTKAYICLESFTGSITEVLQYFEINVTGLNDVYKYIGSTDGLCNVSETLEIIDQSSYQNNDSIFDYKAPIERWREISPNNLTNFSFKIKKLNDTLFNKLFITLKIKLLE